LHRGVIIPGERSEQRISLGTRQLVTFLRAKSAKNGYCWWKQETIASEMKRCGMGRSLRTVNRQIAEAVAAGLITSERHGHGNHYTPCDLVGKVAYRDAAVEKQASSASVGASDTPTWRIAAPPVSITEVLKPEKSCQSESTVQEQREPTVTRTDPAPYEKAQADAIADAVRASGFEPTPDLVGKLERKRRFFGATGFRVAAAISRAFKLVEGTSNAPQSEAWLYAVVENALKADKLPPQRDTARSVEPCGGNAHTATRETPAAHVAPVGDTQAAIVEPVAIPGPRLVPKPAPSCPLCGSDGIVNGSPTPEYCNCERGRAATSKDRGYLETLKRSTATLGPTWLLPDVRKSSQATAGRGVASKTDVGKPLGVSGDQGFPHNRKAPGFQRAGELTGEIQARVGAI